VAERLGVGPNKLGTKITVAQNPNPSDTVRYSDSGEINRIVAELDVDIEITEESLHRVTREIVEEMIPESQIGSAESVKYLDIYLLSFLNKKLEHNVRPTDL
jgi:hypothetical protein